MKHPRLAITIMAAVHLLLFIVLLLWKPRENGSLRTICSSLAIFMSQGCLLGLWAALGGRPTPWRATSVVIVVATWGWLTHYLALNSCPPRSWPPTTEVGIATIILTWQTLQVMGILLFARLMGLGPIVVFIVLAAGCGQSGGPRTSEPKSSGAQSMQAETPEQAVLIHLKLSDGKFGTEVECDSIHALSDQLEAAIKSKGLGVFDGDEFGEGDCTLFIYGPDADALLAAMEPILRASPLSKGAVAIKRYGKATDENAKEVKVAL